MTSVPVSLSLLFWMSLVVKEWGSEEVSLQESGRLSGSVESSRSTRPDQAKQSGPGWTRLDHSVSPRPCWCQRVSEGVKESICQCSFIILSLVLTLLRVLRVVDHSSPSPHHHSVSLAFPSQSIHFLLQETRRVRETQRGPLGQWRAEK